VCRQYRGESWRNAVGKVAARPASARQNSLRYPSGRAHISDTKRSPKAKLRSVLEELSLISKSVTADSVGNQCPGKSVSRTLAEMHEHERFGPLSCSMSRRRLSSWNHSDRDTVRFRWTDWPSVDIVRAWYFRGFDGLVRCAIDVPEPGRSNAVDVAYGNQATSFRRVIGASEELGDFARTELRHSGARIGVVTSRVPTPDTANPAPPQRVTARHSAVLGE
jgi:hypothetical protein